MAVLRYEHCAGFGDREQSAARPMRLADNHPALSTILMRSWITVGRLPLRKAA